MTYRRTMLSEARSSLYIADQVFYYAWSCGLDCKRAGALSDVISCLVMCSPVAPDDIWGVVNDKLSMKSWKRKRSQMRRYVIRNRRAYHHDQALVRQHEQDILRPPFYGVRCGGCMHIPPQPGEVMEEEWG